MASVEVIAFFQALGNESRVPIFLWPEIHGSSCKPALPHLSIPSFLVFKLFVYRQGS
jgi:hypothetical protein